MIYSWLLILSWLVSTSCFSPVRHIAPRSTRDSPKYSTTAHHAFILSDIVTEYALLQETHPIVTASQTAGFLSGLGDVIAQLQQQRRGPFQLDLDRAKRFVAKGLGGGLIWLSWYHLADAIADWLLLSSDGSSATVVERTVLSILLDQFLASPIIIAAWEIPVPILLSAEEDNNNILDQVRSKLLELLIENAKIWTLANVFIYNLPFEYRVLASSMTDVLWQSILSSHVNVMDSDEGIPAASSLPLLEMQDGEMVLAPTAVVLDAVAQDGDGQAKKPEAVSV